MKRLAWTLLALLLPALARADEITVFAAASLQEALDDAARAYEKTDPHKVRNVYAASSALARQLEAGAPADIFISADTDWAEYVKSKARSRSGPVTLATNTLVLVAPRGRAPPLRIGPGMALSQALAGGRIAIADPRAVPAGKYARAALEALGAWKDVEASVAPAADVRAALALVARGEAPLGVVYRTDALAEPGVEIVDTFPANTHPPIVYPMLVLKGARPAADGFVRFLGMPAARAILKARGFGTP
jgi:molybdate transport system substrate-binding protein